MIDIYKISNKNPEGLTPSGFFRSPIESGMMFPHVVDDDCYTIRAAMRARIA